MNAATMRKPVPDPCMGMLPGVVGACCGHGFNQGYIGFEDGTFIYGYIKVVTGVFEIAKE